MESKSYATSYMENNGTIISRGKESANGAGNASVFNDANGVLFVEVEGFERIPSSNNAV